MSSVRLEFHGVAVELESFGPSADLALDELRLDFERFAAKPSQPGARAQIAIRLREEVLPESLRPRGRSLFRTKMCSVWGLGPNRVCRYANDSWVVARHSQSPRAFEIYATSHADLRELAYLALLSSVGEALDRKGLHRVHALGLQSGSSAALLLLPSGGGKSSLAALLQGRFTLFSDESPLLHRRELHAFPLRIALAPGQARALGLPEGRLFTRQIFPPKELHAIAPSAVATPAAADLILLGRRGAPEPRISRIGRVHALRGLATNLVVGLGLVQMTEHFARSGNLLALARIALSRSFTAIRLAFGARETLLFEMSDDARANAEALARFLESGN